MPRGEPLRPIHDGFVPGRFPIDAYGDGGFRFAEMSHRGAILALPSGIHIWPVEAGRALVAADFAKVLAEKAEIDVLLVGCGAGLLPLAEEARWALREAGIGVDLMNTGAAARTYNIMLGEQRRVAAALLPVP